MICFCGLLPLAGPPPLRSRIKQLCRRPCLSKLLRFCFFFLFFLPSQDLPFKAQDGVPGGKPRFQGKEGKATGPGRDAGAGGAPAAAELRHSSAPRSRFLAASISPLRERGENRGGGGERVPAEIKTVQQDRKLRESSDNHAHAGTDLTLQSLPTRVSDGPAAS